MARRHSHSEEPEINITPRLDVVFIMLIFFIVTTSFTRAPGAAIVRPLAGEATPLQGGNILIGVQPNDAIWMAGRQLELREVRQMVERARAAGLLVHPYTFRRDELPEGIASFEELLGLFLEDVGVDGLFTDFPDLARQFIDAAGGER